MKDDNKKGLYNKYIVSKANGNPVDESAQYFVLRIDPFGDDINHIKACHSACLEYAKKIEPFIPMLAVDLRNYIYQARKDLKFYNQNHETR